MIHALLTDKVAVLGTDGLKALMLHVEPHTRSARALTELAASVPATPPVHRDNS